MIALYLLIAMVVVVISYLKFHPIFGGSITNLDKQKYNVSPNFRHGRFRNKHKAVIDVNLTTLPGMLRERAANSKHLRPKENLPIIPFNKEEFLSGDTPKFIWYGHSTLVLRINEMTILIDAMYGDDVTPMIPFSNKRYSEGIPGIIDELPPVDILLITHDHYDHLDYKSIKRLHEKVERVYIPLGVARHFRSWGFAESKVKEFDWWNSVSIGSVEFTFTPSRHYGGRQLSDRAKSLWGGWVIQSDSVSIYHTGDGGYDDGFTLVGEKYGPFDWCFVECGQYNKLWRDNHMFPEDSVRAVIDAKAQVAIPIHWGGFTLAMHPWKEPVEAFLSSISESDVQPCCPRLGEIVELAREPMDNDWFKYVE